MNNFNATPCNVDSAVDKENLQVAIWVYRAIVLVALVLGTLELAQADEVPYRDPKLPIATRVHDLLGRMTLDEKVAQLRSVWSTKNKVTDKAGKFDAQKAAQVFPDGIGQVARPSDFYGMSSYWQGDTMRPLDDMIEFSNAVQRFHVEQTRLGIPTLFHEETAHGFAAKGGTSFPVPLALGSSWDPQLVEQVFTVTAREARAHGTTIALGPVVDLLREPRWGRSDESYGEDPYLVAQMAVAAVRGEQGHSRPLASDRVFSTLKHFIHGAPLGGLNAAPAEMTERTLRENYLVPFAHVIKEADPALIMPSYNEANGIPSHMNKWLLQTVGREELGFRGVYLSDYGGISNLVSSHRVAATNADAAMLAMNAGVDADLPDGEAYANLAELVRSGRLAETVVDAAVSRILALKFEAGLFEHPYVDAARARRATATPAAIALARKAAQESIILLKNDGVLPLDPNKAMHLAVIGPNADQILLGSYAGETDKAVSVLTGIKAASGKQMIIDYAEGVRISQGIKGAPARRDRPVIPVPREENAQRIAKAIEVARTSDIVLLVVGDNDAVTREAVAAPLPGDRSTLNLFGQQDELVEAVLATGKPVIALLLNGRPLAVTQLAEKASALIEGWYLGQESGNAVADILFGKINPSGKLTVSIPRSVGELPVYYNQHTSAASNIYIEGKRKPLYPFGYGLSYTTFELSEPRLSKSIIAVGEAVKVDIDVANTGKRAGEEVVQLYIRDDISSAPRPEMELKAFRKVALKAGEKKTVQFEINSDDLAFWNIDMQWKVEPGTFTVMAGDSSVALKKTILSVGP